MKILIVEDEFVFAKAFEVLLCRMGYESVKIVDNAEDAFVFFQEQTPDLLLMDIHIKGKLNGIQTIERLQAMPDVTLPPFLFVTSIEDKFYFEQAKKLNPSAYILKPFNELVLENAIELALHNHYKKTENNKGESTDILIKDSFFIKVNQRFEKVHISEVRYIEVHDKLINIACKHKNYFIKMSLQNIIEKLPQEQFFRVHRNYIININFIEHFDFETQMIGIIENKFIPFSKKYGENLLKTLNKIV